ncbi:IPP transferase-domain-containing protein [Suillus subaureus]|uniref:IPP transferase-domain-containing protein n=1 Tax=Suillus subaureus TaxID=48587 RepID=A0A9P7J3U4_9AGAM|nr:IPP transferase-domain-containing protein [Suillus subaureus]KAG1801779.1 IPP transferase-domain-containing protein [Suillus subaureus]
MSNLRPIITICGTTGVGKSKLFIELALKIAQGIHGWRGARIINADSMQVYTGMDVITNKVPVAERMGVEHLLMDFKQPGEQYVVGQWVQDAIKAIDETHRMDMIPIIVGGTSYWIQHLMFPNRLPTPGQTLSDSVTQSIANLPPELLELFNALPEHPPSAASHPQDAMLLHRLLTALDEPVAQRWHWRDTRKVMESLRVIKDTGMAPSEIIIEQSKTALIPRYRTLCFWLYAEPSILNERLDARVDDMIKVRKVLIDRSLPPPHAVRLTESSQGRPTNQPCSRLVILSASISLSDIKSFMITSLLQSPPRRFLRPLWSK